MKLTRALLGSLVAIAFILSLAPAFASAQSVDCSPTNSNWWNFWSGANSVNCVQGEVLVYVQVLGNVGGVPHLNPSDFTVNVSGQGVSNASFPGSISGVPVWVTGAYTVTAQPMNSYNVSYSQGCTGTVLNNEQATCIITESSSAGYYPSPTPYPYPYQPMAFTCSASQPTVALGQSANFTVQGGDAAGPYTWAANGETYYSTGPTIALSFQSSGTQLVRVTHSSQTATCSINVATSGYYPAPISPITITPVPGGPGVVVTPTYVPALPNTGFEPMSATGVAYAVVALIAAVLMSLPYVRKAFAALLG